jgi:hypothetical protein
MLCALGNISLPTEEVSTTLKRVRNNSESESPPLVGSSPLPPSGAYHRHLAGSERVSAAIQQQQQQQHPLNVNQLFGLPMYSEDLGHWPAVYESPFELNLPFESDNTTYELSPAFPLDAPPYVVNTDFSYMGMSYALHQHPLFIPPQALSIMIRPNIPRSIH